MDDAASAASGALCAQGAIGNVPELDIKQSGVYEVTELQPGEIIGSLGEMALWQGDLPIWAGRRWTGSKRTLPDEEGRQVRIDRHEARLIGGQSDVLLENELPGMADGHLRKCGSEAEHSYGLSVIVGRRCGKGGLVMPSRNAKKSCATGETVDVIVASSDAVDPVADGDA